ncbi:Hypothetical predicted protein [Paramuricea clavata]|uniref:Uncharacterized protein n=1 Tax=Paramuricea clavata TaxID=317549 RepID=A0A7D9IKP4_PARCT|nr:Hypothetical predicted protein [Paramuricea clavata]
MFKGLTSNPVRTAKWVNITRLSYGIPIEAIADALKPYSKVIQIKMDSFHGVYVGCLQTGHMTKDCPNHARTTGNIINADGLLTRVNRPSINGPHPSITASNADSHSLSLHANSTNNDVVNQQLNNSVTHSDVPNAAVRHPDNSNDEVEFVDVLEELPLPEGEGSQQPVSIVLGKRTREPDDSDVSDISEKRVDRNPSSDGSIVEDDFVPTSLPLPASPLARFSSPNPFSSLSDEVDPISMDHDANGVAIPFERTTSVQRKVRTSKSQMPSNLDDSSPLPSVTPADDSVSIASEILGTPSIEAYEGGNEENGSMDGGTVYGQR